MPEYYVILLCGKILIGHTHWTRQWCCIITHATKQRQNMLDENIRPGILWMFLFLMAHINFLDCQGSSLRLKSLQKCTEESAARTIHRMMTTPMTFLSSAGSRVLVRQNDGSFGSPAKDEKGMPYEPIELR